MKEESKLDHPFDRDEGLESEFKQYLEFKASEKEHPFKEHMSPSKSEEAHRIFKRHQRFSIKPA